MSIRRFKVWRPFPVEWQKKELVLGDTFQVAFLDTWLEVGGGYVKIGPTQSARPDISGARLQWLLDNHYIEELQK